jgi:hypothetical protein
MRWFPAAAVLAYTAPTISRRKWAASGPEATRPTTLIADCSTCRDRPWATPEVQNGVTAFRPT